MPTLQRIFGREAVEQQDYRVSSKRASAVLIKTTAQASGDLDTVLTLYDPRDQVSPATTMPIFDLQLADRLDGAGDRRITASRWRATTHSTSGHYDLDVATGTTRICSISGDAERHAADQRERAFSLPLHDQRRRCGHVGFPRGGAASLRGCVAHRNRPDGLDRAAERWLDGRRRSLRRLHQRPDRVGRGSARLHAERQPGRRQPQLARHRDQRRDQLHRGRQRFPRTSTILPGRMRSRCCERPPPTNFTTRFKRASTRSNRTTWLLEATSSGWRRSPPGKIRMRPATSRWRIEYPELCFGTTDQQRRHDVRRMDVHAVFDRRVRRGRGAAASGIDLVDADGFDALGQLSGGLRTDIPQTVARYRMKNLARDYHSRRSSTRPSGWRTPSAASATGRRRDEGVQELGANYYEFAAPPGDL